MPSEYIPCVGERVRLICDDLDLEDIGISLGGIRDLRAAEEITVASVSGDTPYSTVYRPAHCRVRLDADGLRAWWVRPFHLASYSETPEERLSAMVSTCPPRRIRKAIVQPLPLP